MATLTIDQIIIDDMTGVLMQCIFANTPVVSPESKNPALAGSSLCSNCVASHRCQCGAALPSMNKLSIFLAHFQTIFQ